MHDGVGVLVLGAHFRGWASDPLRTGGGVCSSALGAVATLSEPVGSFLFIPRRHIIDPLRRRDAHGEEVTTVVKRVVGVYEPQDRSEAAADFEQMCTDVVPARFAPTLAKGS